MKVAFVYDRVNKWGGAERVLLALHEIWPEAPLYTAVYNSPTAPWAKEFKVIPSFLQNFPLAKSTHEIYPLFMPMAFESFNFDEYEVVISVTSEAAKGIITKSKTLHICYCLTPTRYLWSGYLDYFDTEGKRLLNRYPLAYLKKWDKIVAERPDEYIAISKTVQSRIRNYYHRESEVVYPPVETDKFEIRNPKCSSLARRFLAKGEQSERNTKYKILNTKYFLVVSRLVKYKKVDLVVESFNKLGWNLKIVGTGREMGDLRKRARENIEFLGQLTDSELLSYYQNCQAVVFPGEEDFGIVPLEAMACGKPVIAYRAGGATETVVEKKTGLFFEKQSVEELVRVLEEFEREGGSKMFRPKDCRKQAEKFGEDRFKEEFKEFVEKKWKNFQT